MNKRQLKERFLFPSRYSPKPDIEAGLYHYLVEKNGTYTRFHLRVEPDGRGLILANATNAARLTTSGVSMTKGFLEGQSRDQIHKEIMMDYRGMSHESVESDLDQVQNLISSLAAPGDNYPIINLEDPALSPYDVELMAPWQADMACVAPHKAIPIINRLWEAGIPHVTFFVYPDFTNSDLVLAVERAEDLGMIAGVRGRASELDDQDLMEDLALAGIDHVTLVVASHDPTLHNELVGSEDMQSVWRLFEQVRLLEISPVAEFPLTSKNSNQIESTLAKLLSASISNVNFVAHVLPNEHNPGPESGYLSASALPQIASIVEERSEELAVRFIWQPPVSGSLVASLNKQIIRGPRCTADVSIRVESNGDVIPPRGPATVAGNLLSDKWEEIWSNDAFIRYRERVERPTRCEDCPDMAICAVDCPKNPSGWSTSAGGDR